MSDIEGCPTCLASRAAGATTFVCHLDDSWYCDDCGVYFSTELSECPGCSAPIDHHEGVAHR